MTNSGNSVADIGEQEYERRNECPMCKREAWDEVELCVHESDMDCGGVKCPNYGARGEGDEVLCEPITILRCKCGHEREIA